MLKRIFQNKFIINGCKTLFFFLYYFCGLAMLVIAEFFAALGVMVYYKEDNVQLVRNVNEILRNSSPYLYTMIIISAVFLFTCILISSWRRKNAICRIVGVVLAIAVNILMHDRLVPCIFEGSLYAPVFVFIIISTLVMKSLNKCVPTLESGDERSIEYKKDS